MAVHYEERELGEAPIRNLPWKLSQTPVPVQRPSPLFGQHTRKVLKSHLEMSNSAIDEPSKAGIIMDQL